MRIATTFKKRTGLVIVLLALAGTLYACTRDDNLTSPQRTTPNAQLATGDGGGAEGQITRARRKHAWLGAVHNEAMRDLVSNREQWIGKDPDNAERVCDGLAALVGKYAPKVNQHAGIASSPERDRQRAREAVSRLRQCRPAATMSVFPAANSFLRMRMAQGGGLSGAFDAHVDSFIAAVEATDGSVGAVAAAGNAAINNATGIPQADFEALVGVVTITDSSAIQWNDYGYAGGFDGMEEWQLLPPPESVFKIQRWRWGRIALRAILIDALACVAAYETGGGWNGCANWAIAGSGAAVMG